MSSSSPKLVRSIGRWTLTGLAINSVMGSAIFGLPSLITAELGRWAPVGVLVAGAVIAVVMLCFAEVSSQFNEAGGVYLYNRVAFGRFIGIEVAWLAWLVRIASSAANANLFSVYFALLWAPAATWRGRAVVLTLMLGFLAAVNVIGVRPGARTSNLFVIAKLVPVVLLLAVAFFRAGWNAPMVPIPELHPGWRGWLEAQLMLSFLFGGFETALISQGEVKNSRRDTPFALGVALLVCMTVYALVQVAIMRVIGGMNTNSPMAAAAEPLLGRVGVFIVTLGALLSMYGYLSAMVLNVPRLTFALGESGDFPRWFAWVHPRFRTPAFSIVIFTVLLWAMAVFGTYKWAVMLSAGARIVTYGSVCAALLVLRRKFPRRDALRIPGPWLFSSLGVVIAIAIASRMGRNEALLVAGTCVIAAVNWWVVRSRTTRRDSTPEFVQ